MSKTVHETSIDGISYKVKKLGAETGDVVLFKLGRGIALQDLTPEDFKWVRNVFKESTQVGIVDTAGDGRVTFVPLASVYDDHFAGRYQQAMAWMQFCWETNFGPFFVGLKDALGKLGPAVSKSPSPKDVVGSSGDSSSASA